ncbi:pyridoxamine 5'-phosphate oxidase family protein [Enterococcus larvae]|uniref:pyridoxamine 5'-phosphate oxidase family protein n=1 Tax=Enterococcus larvae TaxID=2794352 RepID=UPI003F2DC2E2
MELFENELKKVLAKVAKRGVAVLATSAADHVSSRPVSVVVYDEKIVFQTSTKLLKYQQIQKNQQVALCVDNIQIEGTAVLGGRPSEDHRFSEAYREKHLGSYTNYSHMDSSRVIEVQPQKIIMWVYKDKEPYIVTFQIDAQELEAEYYSHSTVD